MPSRAGESDRVRFRGSQAFAVHDQWYFTTRERVDVGPYGSRAEAELNATRLRLVLASIEDPALARAVVAHFAQIPQKHLKDLRSLLLYVATHLRVEPRGNA